MNTPTLPPLPDQRKPWFKTIALRYVQNRVKNDLDGLWVEGLEACIELSKERPIIFAANHVAWWDAMLLLCLDEALQTDGFAIMDAKNLQKLPFFKWVGALGIQKNQPRQALQDLRRASQVLSAPRRCLWIFPQGSQRPAHLRPLQFKGGVVKLAQWTGCPVVPVSIQYVFRELECPAACFSFGTAIEPNADQMLQKIERAVELGLERIDRFFEDDSAFTALIPPRQEQSGQGLGARLLALLAEAA